jgi:hypothetical protein
MTNKVPIKGRRKGPDKMERLDYLRLTQAFLSVVRICLWLIDHHGL